MNTVVIVEVTAAGGQFMLRHGHESSWEVGGSYDWQKTLSLLSSIKPAVVVLLSKAPGSACVELIRHLLAAAGSPPSVIMLSGGDLDRAKQLAVLVQDAQGEPANSDAGQLVVGDLVLCPLAHRVSRQGKEVHLTPRDFMLLEFLMHYPGEVFSAGALLRRVWSCDPESSNEGLRTAICRIRKAIEADFNQSPSMIQNIPRVGYRLRAVPDAVHKEAAASDRLPTLAPALAERLIKPVPPFAANLNAADTSDLRL